MAVKLIIDAGSDLNKEQADALDVILVPMTIRFEGKEYRSGIDITNEEFYSKLAASKDLPTTSQPTPYDFETVYHQLKDAGDEAVVLCVSSALSGTYQSACIAADEFEDCIYVVDTRAVSVAQRILLNYAISLRENAASAKEIAAENIPISQLRNTGIFDRVIRMKFDVENDKPEAFGAFITEIDEAVDSVLQSNR